jgi:hypothetical protein
VIIGNLLDAAAIAPDFGHLIVREASAVAPGLHRFLADLGADFLALLALGNFPIGHKLGTGSTDGLVIYPAVPGRSDSRSIRAIPHP